MKDSHFRTPRTRQEAFGIDTRLASEVHTTRVREWVIAILIGIMIGLMFGWRG